MFTNMPRIDVFHLSWVDSITGHSGNMPAFNLIEIIKCKLQRVEFLLAFSVCIFYCWNPAVAGIIKIETNTSATVSDDVLKVKVRAMNKGNEPAYNVKIKLSTLGGELSSNVFHHLDDGQELKLNFEKRIVEGRKGSYPLTVMVTFNDANQYPFSAVSCSTFNCKGNANPDLVCLGNDISIGNKEELRFNMKNLSFESKFILASVIVPRELSVARPQMNFEVPPRSEKTANFKISNLAALEGASHAVFCYFEYDANDTHYTAVAEALVKIAGEEDFFGWTGFIWLAFALVLILTIILLITLVREGKYKSSKRKGAPNSQISKSRSGKPNN